MRIAAFIIKRRKAQVCSTVSIQHECTCLVYNTLIAAADSHLLLKVINQRRSTPPHERRSAQPVTVDPLPQTIDRAFMLESDGYVQVTMVLLIGHNSYIAFDDLRTTSPTISHKDRGQQGTRTSPLVQARCSCK